MEMVHCVYVFLQSKQILWAINDIINIFQRHIVQTKNDANAQQPPTFDVVRFYVLSFQCSQLTDGNEELRSGHRMGWVDEHFEEQNQKKEIYEMNYYVANTI